MGSERYTDSDGNECDLPTMCRREPGWAANRIAALLAERQRHAEEVDALRAQLRRVEEERDRLRRANETLAVRMDLTASQLLMVGSELCGDGKIDPNDHRDPRWTPTLQRAAEVMRELAALARQGSHLESLTTWRPIDECGELEAGEEYLVRMKHADTETVPVCELITIARWSGAEWQVRIVDAERYYFRADHITHVHRMGPIRGPCMEVAP